MMLDPCSIELFLDNEILNLRRKKRTSTYTTTKKVQKERESEGGRRFTWIEASKEEKKRICTSWPIFFLHLNSLTVEFYVRQHSKMRPEKRKKTGFCVPGCVFKSSFVCTASPRSRLRGLRKQPPRLQILKKHQFAKRLF